MRVMRKRLPLIAAAVFALTACGESELGVDEQRQAACEAFADNTPGTLEMADAYEVLADESASQTERSEALKVTLDQQSAYARTEPYDCDDPADAALFEKHYGTFDEG